MTKTTRPEPRWNKIAEVRAKIAAGAYDGPGPLVAATDRMLDRMTLEAAPCMTRAQLRAERERAERQGDQARVQEVDLALGLDLTL